MIVIAVLIVVVMALQLRSGGRGPGVAWVPRSLRGRVNGLYRSRGWAEPYDAHGDKIPRGER